MTGGRLIQSLTQSRQGAKFESMTEKKVSRRGAEDAEKEHLIAGIVTNE